MIPDDLKKYKKKTIKCLTIPEADLYGTWKPKPEKQTLVKEQLLGKHAEECENAPKICV